MQPLTEREHERLIYLQGRLNAGQLAGNERAELEDLTRRYDEAAALRARENPEDEGDNEAEGVTG
jgi:hypothetical protein